MPVPMSLMSTTALTPQYIPSPRVKMWWMKWGAPLFLVHLT